MPPINNQSSRGGLITATVIFTILFVTATIFAIYFNVQLRQVEESYNNYKKQYTNIVSEADLSSDLIRGLQGARDKDAAGDSVINYALRQRDGLAGLINGSADPTAATTAAGSAFDDASRKLKDLGVTLPAKNLSAQVATLANAVVDRQSQVDQVKEQLKQKQADLDGAVKKAAEQQTVWDKAIADARAQGAADVDKANAQFASSKANIDQMSKDQADSAKKIQGDTQALQAQLGDRDKKIAEQAKEMDKLRGRLARGRPNVTNAAVRQADGHIIRVAADNIVYIDLGAGDQVSAGLTFEIYDRLSGVPALPDSADSDVMPQGKGSLEITRVGSTSSEARLVHTTPGVAISEGDLIENLVYDPNTKYQFYVFGNFDLAQTGRANSADTEVVKRLISQWGGKISDQINVDTDFVVMGKEPELPPFTKEELDQPLNRQKMDKAQAELNKYQEVRQTAVDLHIPLLNQNRFLYYVGYFDQAKR